MFGRTVKMKLQQPVVSAAYIEGMPAFHFALPAVAIIDAFKLRRSVMEFHGFQAFIRLRVVYIHRRLKSACAWGVFLTKLCPSGRAGFFLVIAPGLVAIVCLTHWLLGLLL